MTIASPVEMVNGELPRKRVAFVAFVGSSFGEGLLVRRDTDP